jgi:hypothetical protein
MPASSQSLESVIELQAGGKLRLVRDTDVTDKPACIKHDSDKDNHRQACIDADDDVRLHDKALKLRRWQDLEVVVAIPPV